jgi:hypothetical protein
MSRFGTLELLHKEMANMSNEQYRHCRIGKVIPKTSLFPLSPPMVPKLTLPKMWPFYDHAGAPSPQYMAKCGCKVGTACGNVACPHRLVATC